MNGTTTRAEDEVAFLRRKASAAAQKLKDAEARLEEVEKAVEEHRRELTTWEDAVRFHSKDSGLLPDSGVDRRYARLGPTEAIDLWADEHSGMVVVKDLGAVFATSGGPYNTRQKASRIVDDTIRKNKRYVKEQPGTWRRIRRPKS